MSLSPRDWKGAKRGKKLLVEKIMQGKETGNDTAGEGRRKNNGSYDLAGGPEEKRGPGQGLRDCVEIPWNTGGPGAIFFQRIF